VPRQVVEQRVKQRNRNEMRVGNLPRGEFGITQVVQDEAVDLLEQPHPGVAGKLPGVGVDPVPLRIQFEQDAAQIVLQPLPACPPRRVVEGQVKLQHPEEQKFDMLRERAAPVHQLGHPPGRLEGDHQPVKFPLVDHIAVGLVGVDQRGVPFRQRERFLVDADQPRRFQVEGQGVAAVEKPVGVKRRVDPPERVAAQEEDVVRRLDRAAPAAVEIILRLLEAVRQLHDVFAHVHTGNILGGDGEIKQCFALVVCVFP